MNDINVNGLSVAQHLVEAQSIILEALAKHHLIEVNESMCAVERFRLLNLIQSFTASDYIGETSDIPSSVFSIARDNLYKVISKKLIHSAR